MQNLCQQDRPFRKGIPNAPWSPCTWFRWKSFDQACDMSNEDCPRSRWLQSCPCSRQSPISTVPAKLCKIMLKRRDLHTYIHTYLWFGSQAHTHHPHSPRDPMIGWLLEATMCKETRIWFGKKHDSDHGPLSVQESLDEIQKTVRDNVILMHMCVTSLSWCRWVGCSNDGSSVRRKNQWIFFCLSSLGMASIAKEIATRSFKCTCVSHLCHDVGELCLDRKSHSKHTPPQIRYIHTYIHT